MMWKIAILFLFVVLCEGKLEPYKVLGVNRRASTQDIRKAYKQLAKEWHPDKNDSPDAQNKFVDINAAYELLSDAERRKKYDQHGIVDEERGRSSGGHPENFRQHFRSFHSHFEFFENDFFGGGGHSRGGYGRQSDQGVYTKQSISSNQYYTTVLPESAGKPYIIMFYSDWCFTCLRVEPIWSKLTDELEPVGFGMATVHAGQQRELVRKIGSNELPHIAMLLDGRIIHYKDPQFSALRVLEFVRNKLPHKSVELVDDGNVNSFLNGWHDNRVRVLLFGKTDVIRLRYLATAFKYRHRAKLGYVKVDSLLAKKTIDKFKISKTSDTMLVFHENPNHPVAFVSMQDLSLSTLFEVIESHKFLTLPRLSNQAVMDQLCPLESSKTRKKLCVVLINNGKDNTDPEEEMKRAHLRTFIQSNEFSQDRIKFAYILKDLQTDFVNALVQEKQDLNIAIFWRKEAKKLKYEWFKQSWTSSESELANNKTQQELKSTLQRLLSPNEILSHETVLNELLDEHAASLPMRILNKIFDSWEFLKDNMTKDEVLPTISMIAAVLFIVLGAQCMQLMVSMDEEERSGFNGSSDPIFELKLIEFKAETYNGLVKLLRPGCRTLLLICDMETKSVLASKFFKMMWPYRRNKTLNFAYMLIDKGMPWFKSLLEQTTEEGERAINPKNCVGTVLALNGHRRYFCMYHARHPEGSRQRLVQRNAGKISLFIPLKVQLQKLFFF